MAQKTFEFNPLNVSLPRYDHNRAFVSGKTACPDTNSPSKWFDRRFPKQTEQYGAPFVEVRGRLTDFDLVGVVSMNEQFFAAILGGQPELGHSVVFFEPEQRFYYKDSDHKYRVTSEDKLQALLSCWLMKCAGSMAATVDRKKLADDFRQDEVLKRVVRKARSVLAADESFFSVEGPNERVEGPEKVLKATRQFTLASIQPDPGAGITVSEIFEAFGQYCADKNLEFVDRRQFKRLIAETIREEFGCGLRHDVDRTGKHQQGWKGLILKNRLELTGGLDRN